MIKLTLHDRSVCPGCMLPIEGGQPVAYAQKLMPDPHKGRFVRFHPQHFADQTGRKAIG